MSDNPQRAQQASTWSPIVTAPERTVILTRINDAHGIRNEQRLQRIGRLWWLIDGSMYVYYTPTEWKEAV